MALFDLSSLTGIAKDVMNRVLGLDPQTKAEMAQKALDADNSVRQTVMQGQLEIEKVEAASGDVVRTWPRAVLKWGIVLVIVYAAFGRDLLLAMGVTADLPIIPIPWGTVFQAGFCLFGIC